MKMNALSANPNAADPPTIAIPEALTLPVAAIGICCGNIGRAAIIGTGGCIGIGTGSVGAGAVVTGSVITGAIVVWARGNCAADNGTADQPAENRRTKIALGVGWRRGGESQRGNGGQSHQNFPHGITFLIESKTALSKRSAHEKFHIPLE
jgi:hypothetical protein